MRADDVWDIPQEWQREIIPRRGGLPVTWPAPPEGAADWPGRTPLRAPGDVEFAPELWEEGLVCAAGWARPDGAATPRGAAVVALLTGGPDATLAAEAWILRRGVVFAAQAVAEMAAMIFHPLRRDRSVYTRSLDTAALQDWWDRDNPERRRMHEDERALVSAATVVRARLASATDADYTAACDALEAYRDQAFPQRIIASFLLPTQTAWVGEDIAALPEWLAQFEGEHRERGLQGRLHTLLVLAAGTPSQFLALAEAIDGESMYVDDEWIYRERVLGTLADTLGLDIMLALGHYRYANMAGLGVSRTGGYEDFALATLMAIPTDDALRQVIGRTLDTHLADFARAGGLTRYPERALRVLARYERDPRPGTEGWMPSIYRDLLGTVALEPTALDVLDAEDRALVDDVIGDGAGLGRGLATRLDMGEKYTTVFARAEDRKQAITWLAAIPTDEALGLLAERADKKHVRPALQKIAKRDPVRVLRALAEWDAEDEQHRAVVADVLAHHVLAHPGLTLPELSPAAGDRVARVLAGAASATPVAADHEVPAALAPAKTKRLPGWLAVAALPEVLLRSGAALPEPAVRQLLDLVARSTFAAPQPGLAEVRAACDRASLAGFAWALFTQWRAADHPSADKHAMLALGLLGDDSTVPEVSALFPVWAFGAAARVRTGIEVLGAIGTDLALTHLRRVARKAKQQGFRRQASEKLDQIAAARGLSPAELADRIVPDLDLGADGRLVLDYGPRRFAVTADQWLQPVLTDEDGRPLKRLPKPAAADDAARAAEAQRAYADLKKELKDVAIERLRALEEAMVTERAWTAPDFRVLIKDHPLVRQVARALIWQVDGGPAFRIAEDRTLAGLDDETLTLDDGALVRLFHPVTGGVAAGEAWAAILDDYGLSQPFPQVAREVHRPSPAQAATAEWHDFDGAKAAAPALFAMAARGWRFTDGHTALSRDWPGGLTVRIGFWPGFHPEEDHSDPRTLGTATVSGAPEATFGQLTEVAAAETLRALHRLSAGG